MKKSGQIWFPVFALIILAGTTILAIAMMSSPPPKPADVPAMKFSANRAMQDLAVIAREPHPMGVSQAHTDVRDYLLYEIRALGLEPQVQDTFGLREVKPGWLIAGVVENILVRLPGTDPQGAVLLMAHYDTSPNVPGAADNGSGVVTLLELLRALQAGPPLQQDIVLILTDGEEPGTIGAHAFVAQHPWIEDVRLVINLDTITNAPPTFLRSSAGNEGWIRALARSAPRPAFASLPYHLFPGGNTDLLPFELAGLPGVSIFATGGFPELHTTMDRLEIVNPASVQLAGDQLLAWVRYLGDQPSLDMSVPDQTFFPVLGKLVHYPTWWAYPLAIVAVICFVGTLYYGFRKRALFWRGLSLGMLTLLISLAASVGIANLLWVGIQTLHPKYGYSSFRPHLSDDHLYAIGFIALALSTITFLIFVARKVIDPLNLAAGGMLSWFFVTVAATILLPGSSYLATWILLPGSLALLLAVAVQSNRYEWLLTGLGFLLCSISATILWVPVILIAFLASSSVLLSLMVGVAVLWFGGMLPILERIGATIGRSLPAAAALAGCGFLLAGHFLVGSNSPPPLVNPVGYWLDGDDERAFWLGFSEELDDRQAHLLVDPLPKPYQGVFPEAPEYTVMTSPAPMLDLAGPGMEVIEDAWTGDHRLLSVRFTTSMHDRLYVIIPREVRVLALTIPNNERAALTPGDEGFVLRFDGTPDEGLEMGLELDTPGSFSILLVEERTGLPTFPGWSTQPQPGTMRSPGEFYQGIPTDFTAINRDFVMNELGSE